MLRASPRAPASGQDPWDDDAPPESSPTPPPVSVAPAPPPPSSAVVAPHGGGYRRRAIAAVALIIGGAWLATAYGSSGTASSAALAIGDRAASYLRAVRAADLEGAPVVLAEPSAAASGDASPPPSEPPRADAHVKRDGYASFRGGVVFVPSSFSSKDGSYDLYLHFHGNTHVVVESAEHAGVDALVAVVNLGVGSAPYEHAYAIPGSFDALLENVQRAAVERGLEHPHLARIALGSWSAGYGAIGSILQQRGVLARLDTILVTDGIHTGWMDPFGSDIPSGTLRTSLRPGSAGINTRNLAPFLEAAKAASRGELFFSITHSEVIPEDYASSTETADALLEAAGGHREPSDPRDAPPHLELVSAKGAVSKRLEKHMEPRSEARVGGFHVRGYAGAQPEHHMAHLLQMGATVMPELAARWER